jgi:hypothetical protein
MDTLPYESKDLDIRVVPRSYYISLAPRPTVTSGRVDIELAINNGFASRSIVLHADATVAITNARLVYHNTQLSSVR